MYLSEGYYQPGSDLLKNYYLTLLNYSKHLQLSTPTLDLGMHFLYLDLNLTLFLFDLAFNLFVSNVTHEAYDRLVSGSKYQHM